MAYNLKFSRFQTTKNKQKRFFIVIKFSADKVKTIFLKHKNLANKVLVSQVQKTGKSDLFCQNFKTDFLAKILTKIERKTRVIFPKARLEFSKSGIEISKSRIEKIKSRFFLEKINEKIEKNSEKFDKIKDFFGKNRA